MFAWSTEEYTPWGYVSRLQNNLTFQASAWPKASSKWRVAVPGGLCGLAVGSGLGSPDSQASFLRLCEPGCSQGPGKMLAGTGPIVRGQPLGAAGRCTQIAPPSRKAMLTSVGTIGGALQGGPDPGLGGEGHGAQPTATSLDQGPERNWVLVGKAGGSGLRLALPSWTWGSPLPSSGNYPGGRPPCRCLSSWPWLFL